MSFMNVVGRVMHRSPALRRSARPGPGRRPRPPVLELLEDRLCLSDVTIDATTSGYWDQFGKHIQQSTSYEVGADGRYIRNDFFVFDLTNVGGTITGARLMLQNPPTGFDSIQEPLAVTFVNVDTPIDQLTMFADQQHSRVDIWQDLGGMKPDNQVYGTYNATSNDNGQVITAALTDAAVADLNAAEGRQIAIGGSVTNLIANQIPQEMFNETLSPHNVRQLVLTVSDAGPSGGAATGLGEVARRPEGVTGPRTGPAPPGLVTDLTDPSPVSPTAGAAATGLTAQGPDGATGQRLSPAPAGDGRRAAPARAPHDARGVFPDAPAGEPAGGRLQTEGVYASLPWGSREES
jgi:hypothetical protein